VGPGLPAGTKALIRPKKKRQRTKKSVPGYRRVITTRNLDCWWQGHGTEVPLCKRKVLDREGKKWPIIGSFADHGCGWNGQDKGVEIRQNQIGKTNKNTREYHGFIKKGGGGRGG